MCDSAGQRRFGTASRYENELRTIAQRMCDVIGLSSTDSSTPSWEDVDGFSGMPSQVVNEDPAAAQEGLKQLVELQHKEKLCLTPRAIFEQYEQKFKKTGS